MTDLLRFRRMQISNRRTGHEASQGARSTPEDTGENRSAPRLSRGSRAVSRPGRYWVASRVSGKNRMLDGRSYKLLQSSMRVAVTDGPHIICHRGEIGLR